MRLKHLLLSGCFSLLLLGAPAQPGSASTAQLSWHHTYVVTDSIPPDPLAQLRIYVRASNWPQIKAVEFVIAAAGVETAKPSHILYSTAAFAGNSSCNWLWPSSPQTLHTLSDSAAFIAITTDVASTCTSGNVARIELAPTGSDSLGLTVELRSVRFLLADNTVQHCDTLLGATLFGGGRRPAPEIRAVWPPRAWVDIPARIAVSGNGFWPSSRAIMEKASGDTIVIPIEYDSPQRIYLNFTPALADTGRWQLAVGDSGASAMRAPHPIAITRDVAYPQALAKTTQRSGTHSVRDNTKLLLHSPLLAELIQGSNFQSLSRLPLNPIVVALDQAGCRYIRSLWPGQERPPTSGKSKTGHVVSLVNFDDYFEVILDDGLTLAEVADQLQSIPGVNAIVESPRVQLKGICIYNTNWSCSNFVDGPNDADFNYTPCGSQDCLRLGQWSLFQSYGFTDNSPFTEEYYGYNGRPHEDIDARCAWAWDPNATGKRSTILAIVDTGIDVTHPDLAHEYSTGGNKILDGIDLSGFDEGVIDHSGHGTALAGLAAAITNNGATQSFTPPFGAGLVEHGVAGVAGGWWSEEDEDSVGCSILPIKTAAVDVFDPCELQSSSMAGLAAGINWAATNGADVILIAQANKLESGDALTDPEFDILRAALENAVALGASCISASGDLWGTETHVPAAYSQWGLTTTVGASDLCGAIAGERIFGYFTSAFKLNPEEGTSHGPGLDVLAPGYQLQTTVPTSGLGLEFNCYQPTHDIVRFGTSYSAALVAGMAGGLLSIDPTLADRDIQSLIRLGADEDFNDERRGAGRANYLASVKLISPEGPNPPVLITNTATAHAVVDTAIVTINIKRSGMIPDGNHSVVKHRLRFTVPIGLDCIEPASFWHHLTGTRGWTGENPHLFNYPGASVVAQTPDSVTFETFLYRVVSSGQWLPTRPESAQVSYRGTCRAMGTTDVPEHEPASSPLSIRLGGTPTRDLASVVIRLEGSALRDWALTLVSVSGRRLATSRGHFDSSGNATIRGAMLEVGGPLRAGVYYLELSSDDSDGRASRKLVYLP